MRSMRKAVVGGALAASTVLGGALGATFLNVGASAQTSPATEDKPQHDSARGDHVGRSGMKEEALTGDTAEKVKSAALAAVPGGTVQRVENDGDGAAFEAHMTREDGTKVTVKLDTAFAVTGVEEGHCGAR